MILVPQEEHYHIQQNGQYVSGRNGDVRFTETIVCPKDIACQKHYKHDRRYISGMLFFNSGYYLRYAGCRGAYAPGEADYFNTLHCSGPANNTQQQRNNGYYQQDVYQPACSIGEHADSPSNNQDNSN